MSSAMNRMNYYPETHHTETNDVIIEKSPGVDNISNELLKHGGESIIEGILNTPDKTDIQTAQKKWKQTLQ